MSIVPMLVAWLHVAGHTVMTVTAVPTGSCTAMANALEAQGNLATCTKSAETIDYYASVGKCEPIEVRDDSVNYVCKS